MAKRKKLNMGLVYVIGGLMILGILFGGVYFLSGKLRKKDWRAEYERGQSYYQQAEEAERPAKSDKYSAAVKAYKIAIGACDSPTSDMYLDLAEAYLGLVQDPKFTTPERQRYWTAAEGSVSNALKLDPTHVGSLKMKVDMLWMGGVAGGGTASYVPDYRGFVDTVTRLIAVDPENAEAYFRRGIGYERQIIVDNANAAKAEADFRKAIELDPSNTVIRIQGLIRYFEVNNRIEESAQAHLEGIKANPEDTELLRSYARSLFYHGNPVAAMEQLDRAIAINDQEIETYTTRAQFFTQMAATDERAFEKAAQAYDQARAAMRGNVQPYLRQSDLLRTMGKREEAMVVLHDAQAMIDEKIHSGEVTTADLPELEQDRIRVIEAIANTILEQLIADEDIPEEEREAKLAEVHEYLDQMSQIRNGVMQRTPGYYTIQGRIATLDGDMLAAEENYEKALEINPEYDTFAAIQLMRIYYEQRRLKEAEAMADDLLAQPLSANDLRVHLFKAHILTLYRRYADAMKYIDFVLERDPGNPQAAELLRRMAIDRQQVTPSKIPVGTELGPAQVINLQQQVERMWIDGEMGRALEEMEALHKLAPENLNVIRRLSPMYVFVGRREDAIALYEEALTYHPDNGVVALQLELLKEPSREGQIRIQEEYANSLENPIDREVALARLAERADEKERALLHWRQAAELEPAVARSLERVLMLGLELEDWDQVNWAVEQSKSLDMTPELFEARVAIKREDYQLAVSKLSELIARERNNRQARVLLGRVYFEMKDYEGAENVFIGLIDEDPSYADPVVAMITVAMAQDDAEKWAKWVVLAYELDPNDAFVRNQYLRYQEGPQGAMPLDQLIAIRGQIYESNPLDTENIFLLGRLFEMAGEEESAEAMYKLLYESVPDKTVSGAVLAAYYDRTNQMRKAEALIQDMLKQIESPEDAYLLWGKILGRHNATRGLAAFDKAIELAPTDFVPYDAKAALLSRNGRWQEAADVMGECLTMLEGLPPIEEEDELLREKRIKDRDQMLQGVSKLRVRYLIEANEITQAKTLVDEMLLKDSKDFEAIALEGVLYARMGDNNTALERLTRSLELNEKFTTAWVERGRIYLANGDFFHARLDFEKAIELSGLDSQVAVQLAIAYKQMGLTLEAANIYNDVIDKDPTFEPATRGLLEIHYGNRDWTQFSNLLLDAQRRFNDPYYFLVEANMWAERRDMDRMMEAMDKGLERFPSEQRMVSSYLLALIQAGRDDDALTMAQKYLDHTEFAPWAKAICGRIYAETGTEADADAMFAEALADAKPDQLALVLEQISIGYGLTRAVDKIDELRKYRPNDWQVLTALSSMAYGSNQSERALAFLAEALTLAEDDDSKASVYFIRGRTYYQMERWEECAASYEEALEYAPNNPVFMNDLAYVYADKLDRAQDGLPLAEEAVRQLPMDPQVIDTVGSILYRLKQYDEASRYFTRSINIMPTAITRYHAGQALEAMKKTSDALQQYEQARSLLAESPEKGLAEEIDAAIERLSR